MKVSLTPERLDQFARNVAEYLEQPLYECLEDALRACISNCIRCKHFNEGTEICALVGQRPPARIIAWGCEQFEQTGDQDEAST